MDPYELKRAYGPDITFWGGLGSQSTLSRGTPAEIRTVAGLSSQMARGGGYILGLSKALMDETPVANAAAVIESVLEQVGVITPKASWQGRNGKVNREPSHTAIGAITRTDGSPDFNRRAIDMLVDLTDAVVVISAKPTDRESRSLRSAYRGSRKAFACPLGDHRSAADDRPVVHELGPTPG